MNETNPYAPSPASPMHRRPARRILGQRIRWVGITGLAAGLPLLLAVIQNEWSSLGFPLGNILALLVACGLPVVWMQGSSRYLGLALCLVVFLKFTLLAAFVEFLLRMPLS